MRWTGAGLMLVMALLAGCGSSGSSTSSSAPSTKSAAPNGQSGQTSTEQIQVAPKNMVSSSLEPCDVLTMNDAISLYPSVPLSQLQGSGSNYDHPQIVCLFGSEPNVSFDFLGGPPASSNLSADAAWEREANTFQKVADLEVKAGETEAEAHEVTGPGERAMFYSFPLPAANGGGRRVVWEQNGATAELDALGPLDQLPSEQDFLDLARELSTRF